MSEDEGDKEDEQEASPAEDENEEQAEEASPDGTAKVEGEVDPLSGEISPNSGLHRKIPEPKIPS